MQVFVSVQATSSTYTKQNNCLTSMTGQIITGSHAEGLDIYYTFRQLIIC